MKRLERIYPHAIAILGFILISLIYFYPVLQGKKIAQSDIALYTGMAKEQIDFRATENSEPYWTNSAFGGMPTYQLGANYPHEYINKIDSALRILPRPADYLLLYFLCFYVLLLVLKADPLKAFFGALAFGFSTYLIIILGVGHNSKAHAIAYMPMVVAGILLVFQRRFLVGGLLTMFASALELNANHPQMTYYLLFLILTITVFYSYKFVKLEHRQILGTILNNGIDYSKFGDIIVSPDGRIKVIVDEILFDTLPYLIERVANQKVSFVESKTVELEKIENIEKNVRVKSLRIDIFVKQIAKKSRTKANDILDGKNVKINYVTIENKTKNIAVGDIISIRGYGRFTITTITPTSKGRFHIIYK